MTRIGGTKNPDIAAIAALHPDLVLANEEENRPADIAALRAAGLSVWVTRGARARRGVRLSWTRLLVDGCGLARPAWLADARRAWAGVADGRRRRGAASVVPIWRRPWMALGRDTFAGILLAPLGVDNVLSGAAERYPRVQPGGHPQGRRWTSCPIEPYPFSPSDGPEAFDGQQVRLVSGRHLTWYGPSLAEAPRVLSAQLSS